MLAGDILDTRGRRRPCAVPAALRQGRGLVAKRGEVEEKRVLLSLPPAWSALRLQARRARVYDGDRLWAQDCLFGFCL